METDMSDATDVIDPTFLAANFPALGKEWVFFDNAGGSQTVLGAVEKVTEFLLEKNVQIGGSYSVSLAAADALMLVNAARPEEIVFGPSTTALLQTLAGAMRSQFAEGDEIVVTVADHESNVGPWDRLREFGV
jgi:selenocysteine lyase/cysteine desulfurase